MTDADKWTASDRDRNTWIETDRQTSRQTTEGSGVCGMVRSVSMFPQYDTSKELKGTVRVTVGFMRSPKFNPQSILR